MSVGEERAWFRRVRAAKATAATLTAVLSVLAVWQVIESSQPLKAAKLFVRGEEMRATQTTELARHIAAIDESVLLTEGFEWLRFEDDPVTVELVGTMPPEQAAVEVDLRMRACGWVPAGGVAWARAYAHSEFELWRGYSASFALVVTASGRDGGSTVTVQVT